MASMLVQSLGVLILLGAVYCLQVIPERANVSYIDPKYFDFGTVKIKRYGRQSAYYINMEGRIKHTWANNITIHFIFDEYLHNEYRRSFIEMHFKYCDMINKDPYIGAMFAKNGATCPAPPGEYHLMNMTIPSENFPNVFPFEKGRVNGNVTLTDSGVCIASGNVIVTFKANKSKF